MLAVLRVRADLRGPAAFLHGLAPRGRTHHVGTLDLVERGIARLVGDIDRLQLAADRHPERLALEARHRDEPGHLDEARHVLLVVDLVEQRFLRRLDVHGGDEEVAALERHGRILRLAVSFASSRRPRLSSSSWKRPSARSAGSSLNWKRHAGASPRMRWDTQCHGGATNVSPRSHASATSPTRLSPRPSITWNTALAVRRSRRVCSPGRSHCASAPIVGSGGAPVRGLT